MGTGFDQIAQQYDTEFVHSAIGRMQRKIIWQYLEKHFEKYNQLNILELNCGTGEDAIWMAEKGHQVLATDVSKQMIRVAKQKGDESLSSKNIAFEVLDLSRPEFYPSDYQFDLVFSNFGGFNCISPDSLKDVIPEIAKLLKPNGHLIAVVMPKYCLWESFYFALKGKFKAVFRRNRLNSLSVPVGDQMVPTWYYSPKQLAAICNTSFIKKRKRPVGLFLPPSYLENYFESHPAQLRLLNWKEKMISGWAFLSAYSDHFIIDMEVGS